MCVLPKSCFISYISLLKGFHYFSKSSCCLSFLQLNFTAWQIFLFTDTTLYDIEADTSPVVHCRGPWAHRLFIPKFTTLPTYSNSWPLESQWDQEGTSSCSTFTTNRNSQFMWAELSVYSPCMKINSY